jgi:4-amino-4-deoxy-L-arabinose transferase-like glycosyltransferase
VRQLNVPKRGLSSQSRIPLYFLGAVLAGFVYFFGLDSQHIPKNGDESLYTQVARMTGASGHWLPLQSQVPGTYSKPPLLFWQGIVSTDHGHHWGLWELRYPSVIYTLLTATLVFLLGWRFSLDPYRGLLAALTYLAFFSTYRYGRPFLTDPPETFWLFLPMFIVLYWNHASLSSRWLPFLLGAITGIALLYKSFALVMPVSLAFTWWYLHARGYRLREFARMDAWKLCVIAAISLAMFSMWFVLDPEPRSIWQDFVMHENAGKFAAAGEPYGTRLLRGGSSVWTLLLGAPLNAGLLALPVLALMAAAIRRRNQLSNDEKMLWMWVLVMVIVFSLPSQRSIRYLLPAMPALAVLYALKCESLGRGWFLATLAVCALMLLALIYLSQGLRRATADGDLFPTYYWPLLMVATAFIVATGFLPALTRPGTSVSVLLVLLSIAAFLKPFDGPRGNFDAGAQRAVTGREVWVPSDFSASYETYRFLLPTATIRDYRESRDPNPEALAQMYPIFAVRVPLGSAPCRGCRVLARRLDLRGRLSDADAGQILRGNVFKTLFLEDLLVVSSSIVAVQH